MTLCLCGYTRFVHPTDALRAYYRALLSAWGPQDWWPARTRFEVIVGAFLTQNTAWTNVERTLASLRRARVLSVEGIRRTPQRRLERLIRPSGYFRQKAARLKNFVRHLDSGYGGSLARMFSRPTAELRAELLALNGVGPETADSILLYAGGHAWFVVDAYTRRILERHGVIGGKAAYEEVRELFQRSLNGEPSPEPRTMPGVARPPGRGRPGLHESTRSPKYVVGGAAPAAQVYNEYHALLVLAAKHHCRKAAPQCQGCPLEPYLKT